jgi:hypothetical protein
MKIDARHHVVGAALHCKVSPRDLRNDYCVVVNVNAVQSNIGVLRKIVFEFDDPALLIVAEELQLEPEGALLFRLNEASLESLQIKRDLGETSFFFLPIYRIEGFTEVHKEQPREKTLFED